MQNNLNKKPLIIIIPDYKCGGDNQYSTSPHYAIRTNYLEMISSENATPIIASYDYNSIDDYLNLADGILIIGGGFDLHPAKYQEELHPSIKLNIVREKFEFAFVNKLITKTTIPTLGICNGMQLINVILGGSLIQHIPDHPEFIDHEQSNDPNFKDYKLGYHNILIEENSKLFTIINSKMAKVNSSHHQAVNKIGKNLAISAKSQDGVIEAIENVQNRFLMGVQWHPEWQSCDCDKKIIANFIAEAKKYQINKNAI